MIKSSIILIILIYISIVLCLVIPPFKRYISKTFNVSIQDVFGFLMLSLNCFAIIIMLITIDSGEKSSTAQIKTIKDATMDEIKAIKNATQDYISKLENQDKTTKSSLLSAMIIEYNNNILIMNDILKNEAAYTNTNEGKQYVGQYRFSYEALQANLNNGTISDSVLLDKVLKIYSITRFIQNYIDDARSPEISNIGRANSYKDAIKKITLSQKLIETTLLEMIKYKQEHYK